MIRVYIADDHTIMRQGLRKLFQEEAPEIVLMGESGDGRHVLHKMEEMECDVLLLDLSLPKVSGIEVLRRMRQIRPKVAVLILSMYAEEQYALRLINEGASGYVSKDRPSEELIGAIRAVASGQVYMSPRLTQRVQSGLDDPTKPAHESLTAREHQVFQRLYQGYSVTEIAAELNLSKSTISTYVQHLKEKLNVRTLGEIIRYAHDAGLFG